MTRSHTCTCDGLAASRYHTGEMVGEERIRFELHIEACSACAHSVRAQRRVDELLNRLPTYQAPAILRADRPARSIGWRAGAALLAAAAAAFFFLRTDEAPMPRLVHEALAADAAVVAGMRTGDPQDSTGAATARIPWLGFVTCSDQITPEVEGVYICALRRETPLAQAGVRAGAVLVRIGNRPVTSDTTMYEQLARYAVGEEVLLTLRMDEGIHRVRIALIERRIGSRHPFDMEWSPALVASLDRPRVPDEDIEQMFIPLSGSAANRSDASAGILIGRAPPRESTERTILSALPYLFGSEGLQEGDVITALQGRPVTSRWELMKTFMDVQHVPFTITVLRGGEQMDLHFKKEAVPASQ